MRVADSPAGLGSGRRAVAIGTFDGVHLGHRRVLAEASASGLPTAVVTFDPHPRAVVSGEPVVLLTTLARRLELLAELGADEALVLRFDGALAGLAPEAFAERVLLGLGAEVVVAGEAFRFGRGRAGDLALLGRLGFEVRPVAQLAGVSSSAIRAHVLAGEVERAAALLGRPFELEGTVVPGHARGRALGFPTANVALAPGLAVPARGIYAGAAAGHRAAVSVGVNPHFGGRELRVEAFLLDFDGDLYGRRLLVELWRRLRGERAFADEAELRAQIARDVRAARAAVRPSG
ncbi:MAG: riboflavin biosynthesis protein RibF [Thermoleophilia bacterium]|nr:riboflavin biosynthesis protein RibF [Thermoleophilia bacterium]